MSETPHHDMKEWLLVRKRTNSRTDRRQTTGRQVKQWQRNATRPKPKGITNIKHLVCMKLCDRETIPNSMDTTMLLSKKLHKDNIERRLLDIISRNPTKKIDILAHAIKYVIAFDTKFPYSIQVSAKTRDTFVSTIASISGSDYPEILQVKLGIGKFTAAFTAAYYLSINSLLSFVQALKGIVDYTSPTTVNGRGETLSSAAYEGMKAYKIGKINRGLLESNLSISKEELERLVSPACLDVFQNDLLETITNIPFKLKKQWVAQATSKSTCSVRLRMSFANRSKFRRVAKKTQPIIRGWLIRKKD